MNGKIYKLQCNTGHYYYGSTVQSLRQRLSGHKYDSKRYKYHVYDFINTIGWDNVAIVLVENHKCDTKQDLLLRECELIRPSLDDPMCLNTPVYQFKKESDQ